MSYLTRIIGHFITQIWCLRKKVQVSARAATLEMLTGPWIILSHPAHDTKPAGYVIYFRGPGKHAEEYLYLLDHLMHYQMVKREISIRVRALEPDENARRSSSVLSTST